MPLPDSTGTSRTSTRNTVRDNNMSYAQSDDNNPTRGSRGAFWSCLKKVVTRLEHEKESQDRLKNQGQRALNQGKTVRFPPHSSLEQTLAQRISEHAHDPDLYIKDKFLLEHVILARSQRRRGRPARILNTNPGVTGLSVHDSSSVSKPSSSGGSISRRGGSSRHSASRTGHAGLNQDALSRLEHNTAEAGTGTGSGAGKSLPAVAGTGRVKSALRSSRFSQRSQTSIDTDSITSSAQLPHRPHTSGPRSHARSRQLPQPPRSVRVRLRQDPTLREQQGMQQQTEILEAEYPLRSDPAWRSRLKANRRTRSSYTDRAAPTPDTDAASGSGDDQDDSYRYDRAQTAGANTTRSPGTTDTTVPISHTTRLQNISRLQQSRRRSHTPHKEQQQLLDNLQSGKYHGLNRSDYSISSRLRATGHIPGPREPMTEYERLQLHAEWGATRRGEVMGRGNKTRVVTVNTFSHHVRFALFGKTAPREFDQGKRNARSVSGLPPSSAPHDIDTGTSYEHMGAPDSLGHTHFTSAITHLIQDDDTLEKHIPHPPPKRSDIRYYEVQELEPEQVGIQAPTDGPLPV